MGYGWGVWLRRVIRCSGLRRRWSDNRVVKSGVVGLRDELEGTEANPRVEDVTSEGQHERNSYDLKGS